MRCDHWLCSTAGVLALSACAVACASVSATTVDASTPTLSAETEAAIATRARGLFAPLSAPSVQAPTAREVLGRALFFEAMLSADGTVSCASCHDPSKFGTDGQPKSDGVFGRANPRNAPSVLNSSLQPFQHWRADRASLEEQASRSLVGTVSFGNASVEDVLKRLDDNSKYHALFQEAFAGEASPVTASNFATAVGDFERLLLTPSRFDAYLQGKDDALSTVEKQGLQDFMALGCSACHSGVAVGGQMLQRFGVVEPYWNATKSAVIDRGRADVDNQQSSEYVFKVSALRNVAMTAPYFHDGSVQTLPEAIQVMARVQLGVELGPEQLDHLVAFLQALTGEVPAIFSQPPSGG